MRCCESTIMGKLTVNLSGVKMACAITVKDGSLPVHNKAQRHIITLFVVWKSCICLHCQMRRRRHNNINSVTLIGIAPGSTPHASDRYARVRDMQRDCSYLFRRAAGGYRHMFGPILDTSYIVSARFMAIPDPEIGDRVVPLRAGMELNFVMFRYVDLSMMVQVASVLTVDTIRRIEFTISNV
jgi:hypothetical protein